MNSALFKGPKLATLNPSSDGGFTKPKMVRRFAD
jgi:hypothetical protein